MNTTMPNELRNLVDSTTNELLASGNYNREEAERIAWRLAQHAGWFQTGDGWSRLGPDARDKINMRKAHKQPDGNYLIQDIDCFYPNAVKAGPAGETVQYTADMIRRAISNSNAAASRTVLTRQHPHPLINKLTGSTPEIYGHAINWRESPRGDGHARCDLIDVPQAIVDEMHKRKITTLSAGLVPDAAGLNLRFGHVAMLGSESPALSMLPEIEVHYANTDYLCFSADPAEFAGRDSASFTGETPMPLNPKGFARMKDCYSAMSAAYAAAEANEPGFENKLKQAHEMYSAGVKEFGADFAAPAALNGPGPFGETKVPEEPKLPIPSGGTPVSAEIPGAHSAVASFTVEAFRENPEATFMALASLATAQQAQLGQFSAGFVEMQKKLDLSQFHDFCNQQRTTLELIDQETLDKSFTAARGNKPMLEMLVNMIKGSKKRAPSPADVTVFGAAAMAQPTNEKNEPATALDILQLMQSKAPASGFSMDQANFAAKMM